MSPSSDSVVAVHRLRNGPEENTVHGRGRVVGTAGTGTNSSTLTPPLFGEDLDLHVVRLVVDVDRQIPQLVDDLVDVLGLDLAHVDVDALLAKGSVDLCLSRARDEASYSYAGTKQRQRHADGDV